MNNLMDLLIMFHEIHKLKREGFSAAWIARYLVLDRRTVKKYLNMSEQEFLSYKENGQPREKRLAPYEDFVRERLEDCPDASAAQVHDWLKEHFENFIKVNEKTVFNFVLSVRQKYDIPKVFDQRNYSKVDELPYGKQAQVDFGEYHMTTTEGFRKKVYFFAMVLSASRQKYVVYLDRHFTTRDVIDAHEQCFKYFKGIVEQIVYDQDTLLLVSENHGDLLLTKELQSYVNYRGFKLYFCRKADPQTKGKVENVIKYVKYNFLRGRKYINISILNQQSDQWLSRTGNAKLHSTTHKIPYKEWEKEKSYLKPLEDSFDSGLDQFWCDIRKDNTISYKGNFYRVPKGTFTGRPTRVLITLSDDRMIIYNDKKEKIASHTLARGEGKVIGNNNYNRDYKLKIDALMDQLQEGFSEIQTAREYFEKIRKDNPRYIRDQLMIIKRLLQTYEKKVMDQSLNFCMENKIFKATDMESVAKKIHGELKKPLEENPAPIKIKSLSRNAFKIIPGKSNMSDYKNLMN